MPFEAGQPVSWRVLEGILDDEVEVVSAVAELLLLVRVTVLALELSPVGDAELYFGVSSAHSRKSAENRGLHRTLRGYVESQDRLRCHQLCLLQRGKPQGEETPRAETAISRTFFDRSAFSTAVLVSGHCMRCQPYLDVNSHYVRLKSSKQAQELPDKLRVLDGKVFQELLNST